MARAWPQRTAWIAALAAVLLSACGRAPQDMRRQPKYDTMDASRFFSDGASARPLVPDTVARSSGYFAESSSGRLGRVSIPSGPRGMLPVFPQQVHKTQPQDILAHLKDFPVPVTRHLLERGRERFNINCAPCHAESGYGDGMIVRRGFPEPPSYHTDRLRSAANSHFYDVITFGYGIMYPYADRVRPRDRWAIVAYIRALQLSQYGSVDQMPEHARKRLQGRGP